MIKERDFDARTSVLEVEFWKQATSTEMDAASQVVARYRLLDILAQLLGVPSHYRLQDVEYVDVPGKVPKPFVDVRLFISVILCIVQ
jgi:hypothetical protein